MRWFAVLLFGLSVPAFGQESTTLATAGDTAGSYVVDSARTRVSFEVPYMVFSRVTGEFAGATGHLTLGHLTLDDADPSVGRLDVVIPADSLATPNTIVTSMLKSSLWLDTKAFPTIEFHSRGVHLTGPETADIEGLLTLRGVTRPFVLKAQFREANDDARNTLGFDVSGTLALSDYGVSSFLSMVGDEVRLEINARFEKE